MSAAARCIAIALIAAALSALGTWRVQEWRWQANTIAAQKLADEIRESDQRQQRRFADQAAGQHADALAAVNTKLGDARAQIARLSGRQCLDSSTVGLLNNLGGSRLGLRASASDLAVTPGASASDRDVAEAIAVCRSRYESVSDQLNKILDIEDKRHPPAP